MLKESAANLHGPFMLSSPRQDDRQLVMTSDELAQAGEPSVPVLRSFGQLAVRVLSAPFRPRFGVCQIIFR